MAACMKNPVVATTLVRLLDANEGFALGGRGTTNHCPMALCALAAMGASSGRLEEFFDQWQRRFGIAASSKRFEVKPASWPDFKDDPGAFHSLRDFFKKWILQSNADAVLNEVLRRIPFAPATGAFHAVIRLAYGLDANHSGEIAAGLAALITENLQVAPPVGDLAAAASIENALHRLSAGLQNKMFPRRASITATLQTIAIDPAFQALLQRPPATPALLDLLAEVAIAQYWHKADFTTLHMVTGMDAIRRVGARLPAEMLHALHDGAWGAFCTAYVAIGTPCISAAQSCVASIPADEFSVPPWSELLARAITSDDDHVIKMTYTCWRLGKPEIQPIYRLAAARLIGMDSA